VKRERGREYMKKGSKEAGSEEEGE